MARTTLLLLVVLAPGCTITWGGPDKHTELVQKELDAVYDHPRYQGSTWSPAPGPFEKGMFQSVSSRSPRDDSPSWQGPSNTAGAIGADKSGPGEVSARLDEVKEYHDGHVVPWSGDPTKPGATSSPPAADLDHALDVWESMKAERGIAPVDLSPPKPTKPDEKKGP